MTIFICVIAVIFVISLASGLKDDKRKKTGNTAKWAALAPLIGGTSTDKGVQGQYQGRSVSSFQNEQITGTSKYGSNSPQHNPFTFDVFVHTLTLGSTALAVGQRQSFNVRLSDKPYPDAEYQRLEEIECGPLSDSGNIGQQVLAACSSLNLGESGFERLKFDAAKNELSGLSLEVAQSYKEDIKDTWAHLKSPPTGNIPSPEKFQAHLDVLVRLAEANERLNTGAA